MSGLADGEHHFAVTARDDCRQDATPAVATWLVDTRFPETAWITTPPSLVGAGEPNDFTYEDPSDPDAERFECRLDAATTWTACNGGALELGALPVGTHTLTTRTCELVSEDFVQCDPTPVVYTWEVTESPCPLDFEGPAMACQGDKLVECADGGGVVDLTALVPVATDACAPVSVATNASAERPYGVSPVVFSATDGNGNVTSCLTRVTVVDSAAPTITCPASLDLDTPADACVVRRSLAAAVVTDACWATVSQVSDAPAEFPLGDTVVTFTALDSAGNRSSCETLVTVTDSVPLSVTCDAARTEVAADDACGWGGVLTAEATDNCAVGVMVVERANVYRVGTQDVEFTARDDAGNEGRCVTALTVRDETPPTLACPRAPATFPATLAATASDACTAVAVIDDVVCTRVDADGTRTEVALADCPVVSSGAELEVRGGIAGATLEVAYAVVATDPSSNEARVACELSFATELPVADRDGDRI